MKRLFYGASLLLLATGISLSMPHRKTNMATANNTTVCPSGLTNSCVSSTSEIIDTARTHWNIVGTTVHKNGATVTCTQSSFNTPTDVCPLAYMLLWHNGNLYLGSTYGQGINSASTPGPNVDVGSWYQYTGGAFVQIANDPRLSGYYLIMDPSLFVNMFDYDARRDGAFYGYNGSIGNGIQGHGTKTFALGCFGFSGATSTITNAVPANFIYDSGSQSVILRLSTTAGASACGSKAYDGVLAYPQVPGVTDWTKDPTADATETSIMGAGDLNTSAYFADYSSNEPSSQYPCGGAGGGWGIEEDYFETSSIDTTHIGQTYVWWNDLTTGTNPNCSAANYNQSNNTSPNSTVSNLNTAYNTYGVVRSGSVQFYVNGTQRTFNSGTPGTGTSANQGYWVGALQMTAGTYAKTTPSTLPADTHMQFWRWFWHR